MSTKYLYMWKNMVGKLKSIVEDDHAKGGLQEQEHAKMSIEFLESYRVSVPQPVIIRF